MPYPLVKIKNIKEIPICPAHYFQSYINLQVESANKISSVRKEKVYKNSNKIFLTKNFIKIQQRRIVERVAIYQTNSIDNFIVLNLSNNSLSSAFGNKNINETTPLRGKNKVLKTSGYCEFCKVSLQDRFNHCEEDTHKQNMIKNKKLFDELDKEIGFICEDGKNLMSFNFS
uniref:DBF4-type domain-containing protein n=1 Tax=Parastrongyloides trichosuri TaxID=131310 RepID=A0A0N4ZS12_PARTI